MSVPKCRECEHHRMYPAVRGLMASHWCGHPKALTDGYRNNFMYASEFKTSPKWCPKRAIKS